MPKLSYFPGCSAKSTGISYTLSTDFVCRSIGLELLEIDDWCCCGTSAARLESKDLALGLAARSLALSEAQNPGLDIVAPCAGCFMALKNAQYYATRSEENLEHVRELIDMPYEANENVISLLELFSHSEARERIVETVHRGLGGLKVASYYGCALVRPPEVCDFDDPENPHSMDDLMALVGATPVDWAFKTECCGASNQIVRPDDSRVLIERILQNAVENGAEAIACACPLCMLNLDLREAEVNKGREQAFDIPIYYFTELIALCMSATPEEVGIDRHFHPAVPTVVDALKRDADKVDALCGDAPKEEAPAVRRAAATIATTVGMGEASEGAQKAGDTASAVPASPEKAEEAEIRMSDEQVADLVSSIEPGDGEVDA